MAELGGTLTFTGRHTFLTAAKLDTIRNSTTKITLGIISDGTGLELTMSRHEAHALARSILTALDHPEAPTFSIQMLLTPAQDL